MGFSVRRLEGSTERLDPLLPTRFSPPYSPPLFPFWKEGKYGLYKEGCGRSLHDTWTDVSFADIIGLCFTTPCTITQITIWGTVRASHEEKKKMQVPAQWHMSNTGKQTLSCQVRKTSAASREDSHCWRGNPRQCLSRGLPDQFFTSSMYPREFNWLYHFSQKALQIFYFTLCVWLFHLLACMCTGCMQCL